jgi:polysaccharide biosynthesis/export protein
MHASKVRIIPIVAFGLAVVSSVSAQQTKPTAATPEPAIGHSTSAAVLVLPPNYVIGTEDVLSIVFWHDKDMSADVVVRPDGKITLPLLNEVQAAGFTPEQLRANIIEAASKYVEEPTANVIVKEIHSRMVFITGSVAKPGAYPLTGEMNVIQLIAIAGGLQDYADAKKIVVMRNENGRQQYHNFNYNDLVKQKRTAQNIVLKPGDTVLVP